MSVVRRLPPAKPSGAGTGLQGNFQGYVSSHIAGVTEEELLQKAPREASVERILQQHRLAPGVWHTLATSQSHEELHKSNRGSNYWEDFCNILDNQLERLGVCLFATLVIFAVRISFRRSYNFLLKSSRI